MTAISQQRRVVVFDIGGVLLDWNPRHLYRKLGFHGIDFRWPELLRCELEKLGPL